MTRTAILAFLAVAGPGCASFTNLGSARTLPVGQTQFFVAALANAAFVPQGSYLIPQVELGGRAGATRRLEIGAKGWYGGVAVDTKWQVWGGADENAKLAVAVDPTVGWSTVNRLTVAAPVLAGYRLGEHEIVVALRPAVDLWVDPGAGFQIVAVQLAIGASLGFLWRLSPSLRLMPEVSIRVPLTPLSGYLGGGLGAQGGVALLWGASG